MLPWLMAEIRRRSQKPEAGGCGAPAPREVFLVLSAPLLRCVPAPGAGAAGGCGPTAAQPNPAVFIFEHKAQHISRFIHNSHDLTYFAYLIKAQPDDPESQMACHVFRATDPNQARPRLGGTGEGPSHPGEVAGLQALGPHVIKTDSGPAAGARLPRGALERRLVPLLGPRVRSLLLEAVPSPQGRGRGREAESGLGTVEELVRPRRMREQRACREDLDVLGCAWRWHPRPWPSVCVRARVCL